ncbi:MAG TPA: winged helix DNA-binding domain-containing protein [Chloroflexota bacterium]|nr:winged helix DNA-binding domain-containing protein [Chloroflexota bacterium]
MRLTADAVRRLRARSQRLMGRTKGPLEAARAMCGAQAQDASAGILSLRARLDPAAEVTAADVERLRVDDRALVRTWLMRSTIHLVTAEDYALLLPLVGPHFERRTRPRRLGLGLDDETGERGVGLLCDFLSKGGPLTRDELRERLERRRIPTEGQALVHLAALAAYRGKICFGPGEGRRATFALVDDWLKPAIQRALHRPPPREEALATLVRRYVDAFGPATPEDLATWSGLPMGDVRVGWKGAAEELVEVAVPPVAGGRAWFPAAREAELREVAGRGRRTPESVALLAFWDTYLMGYRSRELTVDTAHAAGVVVAGGVLYPILAVDGRAVAAWRLERAKGRVTVRLSPFAPLSKGVLRAAEGEAQDVGRFLGAEEANLA